MTQNSRPVLVVFFGLETKITHLQVSLSFGNFKLLKNVQVFFLQSLVPYTSKSLHSMIKMEFT